MKTTSPKVIFLENIPVIVHLRKRNSYQFACSLPINLPANEDLESEITNEIMRTPVRDFVKSQSTFS